MSYVLESELSDCSFSLEMVGYRYPDEFADEYDANRLIVRVTAKNLQGAWSAEAPSLLTWEVEDIIRWSRGGFVIEPLLNFVEPELQLLANPIDAERVRLQATLSGRMLPAWREGEVLSLELFLPRKDLRLFAADLEQELARFPYRPNEEA